MKNRYMMPYREAHLLREAKRRFTYSPPDEERVAEHERVGDAIWDAVELVINTCPDTPELQMAIDHLWLARACANGALAVHQPKAE